MKLLFLHRPVMNDRMVAMAISILRSLSREKLGTNQLIEQTSSDKSFVENTIKALNRSKIIKRTRSHEHRQKKINELDHSGQEIIKVLHCIEQYNKSYIEFYKVFKEKLPLVKNNKIQSQFSLSSLNRNEVIDHDTGRLDEYFEQITQVIGLCIRNICNILIYIYSELSGSTMTDKISHAILNRIILDSLSEQISACREGGDTVGLRTNFIIPVIESLIGDNIGLELFADPLIGNETKNLISSLLNLFVIPSGEENLSDYSNKYYPKYIENLGYKPRKDLLKKYDLILKDSS